MGDLLQLPPCPTCSGPSRETVGMVCPTCATDYALAAKFEAHTRSCESCGTARQDAEHLAQIAADHYYQGPGA